MNLYLLERMEDSGDFEVYDGAVVAAENATDAVLIHPSTNASWNGVQWTYGYNDSWVPPNMVKATLIGTTDRPRGVILASYIGG